MAAAPDGSTLDVVVPVDANTKLAIIGVEAEALGAGGAVGGWRAATTSWTPCSTPAAYAYTLQAIVLVQGYLRPS